MKTNLKRALLFIAIMAFVAILAVASFAAQTGNANSDGSLTYSLDGEVLTFSGTATKIPANMISSMGFNWKSAITKVVIEAPVTEIGQYGLARLNGLRTLVIPESLTTIRNNAFVRCDNLTTVSIAGKTATEGIIDFSNIKTIESVSFADACNSVQPVILFGSDLSFSGYNTAYFFNSCAAVTVKAPEDSTTATTLTALCENLPNKDAVTIDIIETPAVTGNANADGTLTYSLKKGILTISGTATKIPNNMINDYIKVSWDSTITKVIIDAQVTEIGQYGLARLNGLETIVIPSTLTTIRNNALSRCDKLKTVYVSGTEETVGVIDFRNITTLESVSFSDACNSSKPVVLFNDNLSFANYNSGNFFNGCADLTIKVTEESVAATTIAALLENAPNKAAVTLDLIEIPAVVGNVNSDGSLTYHIKSGVLTISGNATAFEEGFSAPWKYDMNGGANNPKYNIKKIVIDAPLTELPANVFTAMRVLEAVIMPESITALYNSAFAGCWNLDTLALSEEALVDGVMDFTKITNVSAYAFDGIAKNVTPTVLFNNKLNFSQYKSGSFFQECASVTVNVTEGSVAAKTLTAFRETASNKNAINIVLLEAPVVEINSPVSFEGFGIRLEKYNGLRGMFKMDPSVTNEGLTLKEYGAVAISKANYSDDLTLTLNNGEYVYGNGIKTRIWDSELGFIREDGVTPSLCHEDADGNITYSIAIVNYTSDNYNKYIYMAAYAVYTDGENDYVCIESYPAEDYKFFSIYNITLDMYISGFVNASNSDENAVWNTLLMGAQILTAGTHYTYTEGMLDLNGNDSFKKSFRFAEVPVCTLVDDNNYAPVESGVTLTLLRRSDANGDLIELVAVYRCENKDGSIPALKQAWNNGPQYSSRFATKSGRNPNPALIGWFSQYVNTVIVDEGITTIESGAFGASEFTKKYVFAESVKTVADYTFWVNRVLTTVYHAHPGDASFVPTEGVADLSGFTSLNARSTFEGCNDANGFTKVILPAGVVSIQAGFASAAPALTEVVIPDSCTEISSSAFMSGVNIKIVQTTYNEKIAAFCASNGYTYSQN